MHWSFSSSPRKHISLTIAMSLSMNSLTFSLSCILKVANSLLRFNIYICGVLLLPWSYAWTLSNFFLVPQVIVLVNIVSLTNECKAMSASKLLATFSSCCFIWAMVRLALSGCGCLSSFVTSQRPKAFRFAFILCFR